METDYPMAGEQFYPAQMYSQREGDQLLKVILENEDLISLLEHEFRGEIFVVTDTEERWIKKYTPIINSEEGINEILRILRFMGMNKVSILTNLTDEQINTKLKTFECKLADLFFLKRKEWGMNKETMPMIYELIISIVEDAFYRAKDGNLIKTLRSTFQRTEVSSEDRTRRGFLNKPPVATPFG